MVSVSDQPRVATPLDRPPESLEGSGFWRKRLTLPTYTAAEAARYAQAKPQTVGYWFGEVRRPGQRCLAERRGNA